ncbi:hypothetical protein GCM10007858_25150 [Bradyrhizobium liaoningense]|nr:hypothetical protein GCM10007858_25150 [Bradyrhizobium liaoningense]
MLCAAASEVVSVSASSAPASLAIVFFIGVLRSAGGTIEQRDGLEKHCLGGLAIGLSAQ